MLILPRLGESDAAIASVTAASLAYAPAYVVADHYLHVSGRGCRRRGGPHRRGLRADPPAPQALDVVAPAVDPARVLEQLPDLRLRFDAGGQRAALPQITWLYVGGLVAVALGAFVARIIVVFGMLPVLEIEPARAVRSTRRYKVILVWGGLRGAVTIVLAMVAASDGRLSDDVREFAAGRLATLFVLYTLFVNATTLGLVMGVLGLNKLTRLELALRDRVLALSHINVTHHMQQIIREHTIPRVEGIDADPLSAGDEQIEAPPPELALDPAERLRVGLVTLCTQERELYLEQFEQQTLSRRMVARLAARADRLVDAVRDRGAEGYQRTIRGWALPDSAFRLALWLHRRLGIDRLLTQRLADRFEILMVQQDVLAELALFNVSSVGDLLGAETEEQLDEVIRDRQQLVAHALHALVLQYPGYAESIRDRQLERAAIRLEAAEYARRLRESIIGREVYADLRRQLNKRRDADRRPPAARHLGLELQERLIACVPLITGLDKAGYGLRSAGACARWWRCRTRRSSRRSSRPRRHVFHRRRRGDGGARGPGSPSCTRATSSARWACSTTSRAMPT